ncbi:50S ribosomal protein L21 [Mycoplasma corogypsi]|uniref:50S ribosomal protein L21 n=1 Tax=Mycoplasma corogypsi TaxID=2106 RepID=UPI003872F779
MFAIIETGGKQLLVKEGQTIFIEKINGEAGQEVKFEKVLLVDNKIGRPYLEKAIVTGIIEKQGKQRKIVVYRHNAKSTHKRKLGHRQPYTRVKITGIKG